MTRAERVERAIKQARKLRHLASAEANHYVLMNMHRTRTTRVPSGR